MTKCVAKYTADEANGRTDIKAGQPCREEGTVFIHREGKNYCTNHFNQSDYMVQLQKEIEEANRRVQDDSVRNDDSETGGLTHGHDRGASDPSGN